MSRQNQSPSTNSLLNSLRQRMSSKALTTLSNAPDFDQNLSSPSTMSSSPNTNSPPLSSSIPIKSPQQQQTTTSSSSSSFLDYLSSSFSNRLSLNEKTSQITKTPTSQSTDFIVPPLIPSRQAWVSDDEVTWCMCCNTSQFSMFNRRHHCRRCGRVVCKLCSQQMTIIKNHLERTCKDCYQYMQNSSMATTNTRLESSTPTKKNENLRQ